MSKRNFVCFECHVSVRREPYSGDAVLCPECGQECHNIGYKIPVPPKSKPEAWKALHEEYFRGQRENAAAQEVGKVRRKHALEKEIAKLEARPENDGRSKEIRRLRRKLGRF